MTEIILHIGHNKTGSTSIQRALADLEEAGALDKVDALYPTTGRASHVHHSLANLDPLIRHRRGVEGEGFRRQWAALRDEINATTSRKAIISAESFSYCDPGNVKRFTDEYFFGTASSLRAVCYIRPHASMALSAYSQRVVVGEQVLDFRSYAKKALTKRPSISQKYLRWLEVYGGDFIARPFLPQKLVDGDVVADFFDFAFPNERGRTLALGQSYRENSSRSALKIEAVRRLKLKLQQMDGFVDFKRSRKVLKTGGALIDARFGHVDAPRLTWPRDLIERFHASWRDDAKTIDDAFWNGEPLFQDAIDQALERTPKDSGDFGLEDAVSMSAADLDAAISDILRTAIASNGGHIS